MKRKLIFGAGCLMVLCLTACQGSRKTVAEADWKAAREYKDVKGKEIGRISAKEARELEEYVKGNRNDIDEEALKAEAGSAESSLSQKFKAVALLCELEYQKNLESDNSLTAFQIDCTYKPEQKMYYYDYPVSTPYVDQYLAASVTDSDKFWESLQDAFYPYDCFKPMFAAAEHLDGETLKTLITGVPGDSKYEDAWADAIEKWIREKPGKIIKTGEELTGIDYFKDWELKDWKWTFFYNDTNPGLIKLDTVDDAIAYISYVQDSMLPVLESQFGREEFFVTGKRDGQEYMNTQMTVTVGEELPLKEGAESLSGPIGTEGKKVIAFYRNPGTAEFKNSPAPLRILGDFMLSLPKEEYPGSMAEADYFLVMTPDYQFGEYYKNKETGKDTPIQEIHSSTSIDLYDAKTGELLRHLGNMIETSGVSIAYSLDDDSPQYPEPVSAEVLSFIYHNVNEPDKYTALLNHTAGTESVFQKDEPVMLGDWEIAYHSSNAVKSFDDGLYHYKAKDGCQLVRAEFTVTNWSSRQETFETFFPMIPDYRDVLVQITDAEHQNYYVCSNAPGDERCLDGMSLEPGESKDGELIFEVPDEVVQGEGPYYVQLSMGKQSASYLMELD